MEYKCHPTYKYAIFMLLVFWIISMYLSFVKDKGIIFYITLAITFTIIILDFILIENHIFIFDIEEFDISSNNTSMKNKKSVLEDLDNIEEKDLHLTKEEIEYLNE